MNIFLSFLTIIYAPLSTDMNQYYNQTTFFFVEALLLELSPLGLDNK